MLLVVVRCGMMLCVVVSCSLMFDIVCCFLIVIGCCSLCVVWRLVFVVCCGVEFVYWLLSCIALFVVCRLF